MPSFCHLRALLAGITTEEIQSSFVDDVLEVSLRQDGGGPGGRSTFNAITIVIVTRQPGITTPGKRGVRCMDGSVNEDQESDAERDTARGSC